MSPTEKRKKQEKILKKLEDGYSPNKAARAAGIHRQTLKAWREEDEEFDYNCAEAVEAGTDEIEDVALGLAKKGNGIVCLALLNARRPEKFKRGTDRSEAPPPIEFTINIGNKVQQTLAVSEAGRGDIQSPRQVREPGSLQPHRSGDEDR